MMSRLKWDIIRTILITERYKTIIRYLLLFFSNNFYIEILVWYIFIFFYRTSLFMYGGNDTVI